MRLAHLGGHCVIRIGVESLFIEHLACCYVDGCLEVGLPQKAACVHTMNEHFRPEPGGTLDEKLVAIYALLGGFVIKIYNRV
jgi:hypothetical protein